MQPFTRHRGVATALDRANVDTDQIIPVQFLTRARAEGFGDALFFNLRREHATGGAGGIDWNEHAGASILIAGPNFGCGSAREQAVWALMDFGFRCVIAQSFGDLFAGNAANNGLLLVAVDEGAVTTLRASVAPPLDRTMTVDLLEQTVMTSEGQRLSFTYDPFWKEALLEGKTELEITLSLEDQIASFEGDHRRRMDWVFPAQT
jgi:3-isopropylmalate/(R)-2-methylmalate dehydratase small subunit